MQDNYQSSSGYKAARARKYDAYIPPTAVGREPVPAQPHYAPVHSPQPTSAYNIQVNHQYQQPSAYQPPQQHQQSSLDFIQKSQFQQPQQQPIKKITLPNTAYKKKASKPKRTLFSAILKATVQVDKVTRQSMQAVKHTFEPPEIVAKRSRRQKLFHRTFYVVGTASFVMAIGLGIKVLIAESPKQRSNTGVLGLQAAAQNDANRPSEAPSEQKPTKQDLDTYLVAQPYPRYISISSLGLEARVRRLGLDSKGAVGSPNNIFDVGWYDGSVRPGEKDGSSVLVGHVAGPSQQGIFWGLPKIEIDAIIVIEKGNGESIRYRVTKVDKLPAGDIDMTQYIKSDVPGTHDLKLITIAGKYATLNEQYSGRLVVTAVQQ